MTALHCSCLRALCNASSVDLLQNLKGFHFAHGLHLHVSCDPPTKQTLSSERTLNTSPFKTHTVFFRGVKKKVFRCKPGVALGVTGG
jgi:hypothetical protein